MPELIIDSHQHIWDPSKISYDWLGPDFEVLNRTFTFDELKPQLEKVGITKTVMVQSADNFPDTNLMLECVAQHEEICAIVGFLPLDEPSIVEEQLPEWSNNSLFVGVRNLIHTKEDPYWILQPKVLESLRLLEYSGLTLDLVAVFPNHLNLIPTLSEKFPELKMVIDHLGKPPASEADFSTWKKQMGVAAQNPLVYSKVSGLYGDATETAVHTATSFSKAFEHVLSEFGPHRMMYGGDWPINLLDGGYAKSWNVFNFLIADLAQADKAELLATSALRFYGIPEINLNRNVR